MSALRGPVCSSVTGCMRHATPSVCVAKMFHALTVGNGYTCRGRSVPSANEVELFRVCKHYVGAVSVSVLFHLSPPTDTVSNVTVLFACRRGAPKGLLPPSPRLRKVAKGAVPPNSETLLRQFVTLYSQCNIKHVVEMYVTATTAKSHLTGVKRSALTKALAQARTSQPKRIEEISKLVEGKEKKSSIQIKSEAATWRKWLLSRRGDELAWTHTSLEVSGGSEQECSDPTSTKDKYVPGAVEIPVVHRRAFTVTERLRNQRQYGKMQDLIIQAVNGVARNLECATLGKRTKRLKDQLCCSWVALFTLLVKQPHNTSTARAVFHLHSTRGRYNARHTSTSLGPAIARYLLEEARRRISTRRRDILKAELEAELRRSYDLLSHASAPRALRNGFQEWSVTRPLTCYISQARICLARTVAATWRQSKHSLLRAARGRMPVNDFGFLKYINWGVLEVTTIGSSVKLLSASTRRSHDASFMLFRLGSRVSAGARQLAETGSGQLLEDDAQGTAGVMDAFTAPAIQQGAGRTEAEFFLDGNHSRVSIPLHSLYCRLTSSQLHQGQLFLDSNHSLASILSYLHYFYFVLLPLLAVKGGPRAASLLYGTSRTICGIEVKERNYGDGRLQYWQKCVKRWVTDCEGRLFGLGGHLVMMIGLYSTTSDALEKNLHPELKFKSRPPAHAGKWGEGGGGAAGGSGWSTRCLPEQFPTFALLSSSKELEDPSLGAPPPFWMVCERRLNWLLTRQWLLSRKNVALVHPAPCWMTVERRLEILQEGTPIIFSPAIQRGAGYTELEFSLNANKSSVSIFSNFQHRISSSQEWNV
ncbi:hypothetical protein PR048_017009 [Dryococelus australis]|uniref:Spondin domain-containing protein n=1 Tax=Dryococelus australis TaxID=614101 RepID=A0ABQ9H8A9_9NEOP|nr:hypothetical protein PR048_017009 [Dryococelus australis]